jgi:hypothetical protein
MLESAKMENGLKITAMMLCLFRDSVDMGLKKKLISCNLHSTLPNLISRYTLLIQYHILTQIYRIS